MAQFKPSPEKFEQLVKRQWTPKWGADYEPSIRAEADEAPSKSEASVLHPSKMNKRGMHLLSEPETWSALLALYHPRTFDIHEQRILYPGPMPHPLYGHPKAPGRIFSGFRGTVEIAEELGMEKKHPTTVITKNGKDIRVPFPYVGDLLLFLEDESGPYVVNWTVKDSPASFVKSNFKIYRKGVTSDPGVLNRHLLEKRYYEDAAIPTRQVSSSAIDPILRGNLRRLFLSEGVELNLTEVQKSKAIGLVAAVVGTPIPAYIALRKIGIQLDIDASDLVTLVEQAIWTRRLRVDLFRTILWDKPLAHEKEDALVVYKEWFAR